MISLPRACSALLLSLGWAHSAPLPIKVVIVTTYEEPYLDPKGTGASEGEARRWIQGYHLDRILPLPAGFHPVRLNADGVLETMTGMATARAAASTMALGLDPRFDLTHAYWILAGTAGIDPQRASVGSAAWAEWVVDGDIANRIDPREIPAGWPDGTIPWDAATPFDPPGPNIGQFYQLRPSLVAWAFHLTEHVRLPDTAGMKAFRSRFVGFPEAQRPPFVLTGDNLSSATYWQGRLETERARRWVKVITGGKGTFTTSSCEDAGFLQALAYLGAAGKADARRALVLRAGSDYCVPRPGVSSADSLKYGTDAAYMAEAEAFDSAFQTGRVVVDALVRDWSKYRENVP